MNSIIFASLVVVLSASAAAAQDDKSSGQEPPAEAAPEEECSVAVMMLEAKGLPADQAHVPELLTNSLAAEITKTTDCKVITQADISQMLDFEATKATCTDASESCIAEIGDALGVQRIVSGNVGKLGNSFKLQAQLQNLQQARVESRVDILIGERPEALDLAARNAGRELFGIELLEDTYVPPPAASTTPAVSVEEVSEPTMLPTILLVSGISVAAVGAISAVGGLGFGGFVASEIYPKETDLFGSINRKTAQSMGVVSEIVGIAGIAGVVIGVALASASLVTE